MRNEVSHMHKYRDMTNGQNYNSICMVTSLLSDSRKFFIL